MQAAGVGFVTLGVFSWALLEPRPGAFDFGWMDEVVGLLADGGHRGRHGDGDGRAPAVAHRRAPGDPARRPGRAHALAGQQAVLVPQLAGVPGACARARRADGASLRHAPGRAAVARVQRAGVPQRAVLVRRLGRGVPALARRALRRHRAAQRRLGHRVLEPALHDVRRSAAAADHACGAQPDPAAGLRPLLLRRLAGLPPRRARRPPAALDRAGDDELHGQRAPVRAGLLRVGTRDGRRQPGPLPRPPAAAPARRAGVRRRSHARGRGRVVAAHGVGDVGGELAAGERREAAWRAARGLAAPRRARGRRRRVLPVARVAGGRGEVPLRAGAARRAGLGAVPRGGRARARR